MVRVISFGLLLGRPAVPAFLYDELPQHGPGDPGSSGQVKPSVSAALLQATNVRPRAILTKVFAPRADDGPFTVPREIQ